MSELDVAGSAGTHSEAQISHHRLKAGEVKLAGAVMQNVTHIAPAIAAFFFTQTIVGFSGAHAPLAYLIGFVLVLGLGWCLVQLARNFPSAGGYFTYASRTLGPSMGFMTGWTFTFYSPIVAGPVLAYLGFIIEGAVQTYYHWTWFHWWMLVVVALPLIALAGYRGISFSVKSIVIVGAIEFMIVFALALSGLIDPGPGGFTFKAFSYGFNPGGLATASGFTLAIVFTVQGLTGWEAAAPLAEETTNPRRNVPWAIMLSIAIIGAMLVIAIWGQVIGWGTNNLKSLISSPQLPALVIARRVWGSLWFLALIAMITSGIGASLACQNVATRMWYGMGRSGVLPKPYAQLHGDHKTPTLAVTSQLILSLVLGLILPLLLSPLEMFILSVGFVLVIAVILVYVAANLGVLVYFWRERRSEFNWFSHALLPVGTSAVLIYSLIKSFTPFPAYPYNLSPWIVIGWLVIGVGILFYLRSKGGDWFDRARDIADEDLEMSTGSISVSENVAG
jgi:amino acid transporter